MVTKSYCWLLLGFGFLLSSAALGVTEDIVQYSEETILLKIKNEEGCMKAALMNELAFRRLGNDLESSFSSAQAALKLSKEFGCELEKSDSYNYLGACHKRGGYLDSAIFYYEKSLAIRIEIQDSSKLYGINKNLGEAYRDHSNYGKSIDFLKEAKRYTTHQAKLAQIEISLSSSYRRQGNWLSSAKSVHKALELLKHRSQSAFRSIGDAHLAYAYLCEDQRDYENALAQGRLSKQFYEKAKSPLGISRANLSLGNSLFRLGRLDSAIYFFQKMLQFKSKTSDVSGKGKVMVNLGQAYNSLGVNDSAIFYFKMALEAYNQFNDVELGFLSHEKLADVFMEIDSFPKAQLHYEEAYKLASKLGDPLYQLDVLEDYSTLLRRMGRFEEASSLLVEYTATLQDVKAKIDSAKSYELELARRRKRLTEQENEILKEKTQKQLMQIYLVIGGALVVIMFLLFVYQREKYKRKLASRDVDELLKKQELKSIVNVLDIQEKERRRIAQDLHDRLGGMLATMKLLFHDVQSSIGELQEKSKGTYDKALGILDKAGEEVRHVAHNLVSGALKNFGLESALKELASTIQSSESVQFTFICHGIEERLNTSYESHLYRIVQEMVSNTLKHAKATKISLQLVQRNGELSLVYEDNGKGFVPDEAKEGMGLKSIASRVNKLDGTFEVDSGKGAGTTYNITVNLNNEPG